MKPIEIQDNDRARILETAGVRLASGENKRLIAQFPNALSVFKVYAGVETKRDGVTGGNRTLLNRDFNDGYDDNGTNRTRFTGCTVADVKKLAAGEFDPSRFLKARERITKQIGSLDTLQSQIARRRKRNLNDQDGEIDFDRLYDINYFHAARIENSAVARIVNITVGVNISVGIKEAEINDYGAMVWSVIDLLERSGIQCSVTMRWSPTSSISGDPKHYDASVVVKTAGEYIDPMNLARCFTSAFFRRALFSTLPVVADAIGSDAETNRGFAPQGECGAKQGEIQFDPSLLEYQSINFERIREFITTAVTG
jgi:hypothetical protein